MNRLFVLVTAVATLCGSVAQAGVMIVSGTPVDLGDGLVGVTVKAVGTEGDNVSSLLNISFTGVHQVWKNDVLATDTARRTATLDEQGGVPFWDAATYGPLDSVFLFDKTGDQVTLAPGTSFSDTNDFSRGAIAQPSGQFSGVMGMGNLTLNGQVTYLQSGGFAEKDIAYLVLPVGGQASYSAQFYVANSSVAEDVISGIISGGGDPGGDPIFESTPGSGSTLDFGYGASTRTLNLAVRNVGDPDTVVNVASFELRNNDLGLYSLPGFTALALEQGAGDSNIVVQFDGSIGTPGIYTADLDLLDGDGNVLATYALTAQVPEPSTVALAGLGLLGLVGFARRRG